MGRNWAKFAGCLLSSSFALAGLCILGLREPAPAQEVKKVSASPLDEPLGLLYESRKAYAGVRDYTATLLKRESLATNPDDNIIQFKFRDQPLGVYMRWLGPAKYKNQEVAYCHGKNRNKLRVHAKGFFKGIAGFVSVDVDDPRVRDCSRHNIYEAGIGHMIERCITQWESDRKTPTTDVKIEEYEFNKKRCTRIETIQKERRPDSYAYRVVLFIDQETKLPIRNENYSWPRPGGAADGDLFETVSYIDLRLNVGLTDRDFDK